MSEILRALNDEPDVITDDEILYRVIQKVFVREGVASSQGFQDYPSDRAARYGFGGPCASVSVQSVWRLNGADPKCLIEKFDEDAGVVRFRAGDARNLASRSGDPIPQGFMMDPLEGQPWHAVMFDRRGSRSTAAKKALALISEWVFRPGDVGGMLGD